MSNTQLESIRLTAIDDSSRFARSRSAPPEVKIREIKIHERFSFLRRDYKLESIRIDNICNPPSKPSCAIYSLTQIDLWYDESTEGSRIDFRLVE